MLIRIISVAALSWLLLLEATAQPVNDNFANALPLTGAVVTTTGSNVGATRESGEPNIGSNIGGASVWWAWTAPGNGAVTIDTSGSSFNTMLGVYTGSSVNALTLVASNDDYSTNLWSRVSFVAVGGTVYRIAVDGHTHRFVVPT